MSENITNNKKILYESCIIIKSAQQITVDFTGCVEKVVGTRKNSF